ncbi:RNA transcription [Babesia duncani]|uniref:RNA transcription n=1 Tax=Babesia duncani TaxID=323732 RepID=A0AAD9PJS3_9APIC|nr:RNA transcription [Babesia duncani]
MLLSSIEKKFKLLGYQQIPNLEEKFKEIVLKLEEENIRHYEIAQRTNLKSDNPDLWFLAFQKYCKDVNIDIPSKMIEKPNFTSEGKNYCLNELLNLALSEMYLDKIEDGTLVFISSNTDCTTTSNNGVSNSLIDGLNEILMKLEMPTLQYDSPIEEIKSAFELLLQLRHHVPTNLASTDLLKDIMDIVPNNSETSCPTIKKASAILRCLHTQQLSQLHKEIVYLCQRFQQLIGNPLTNIK